MSEDEIILKDQRKPRRKRKAQVQEEPVQHEPLPGQQDLPTLAPSDLIPKSWVTYCEWRRSKCNPDYAPEVNLTRATLEYVGELAELAELFGEHGHVMFFSANRDRLIDEIGDVLFTGTWVLDAIRNNPLDEPGTELELAAFDDQTMSLVAQGIRNQEAAFADQSFMSVLNSIVLETLMNAQTSAGLLSNMVKKLVYQGRAQDVNKMASRVAVGLIEVNRILSLIGATVEDALTANVNKLNARFPNGYEPGGGNRTGAGK